jgi:DNA-binding NtrC family response regulator
MNAGNERILLVDDEKDLVALFKKILEKQGYQICSVYTAEDALKELKAQSFDLVITDLKLPGMTGLELVKKAKAINPTLLFIMLTGFGTVPSAVEAMKQGAHDYLLKPIDIDELVLVAEKALEVRRLTREVQRLRSQLEIDLGFEEIIGRSKPMCALFRVMKMVAHSSITVLIQGESGTGKELAARALHQQSPRHNQPFVAVNCAAVPETLLESELFGHARGAFTGAVNNKRGLFEEAQGGTLLLDEVGDTTPAFQSKLLRVIQENEIRPLGTNKSVKIDVRVIAATNKDLKREVERKTFRTDLYYRLAVLPLHIPPLRDRRDDIPLLVDHFINKYSKQNELVAPKGISPRALGVLVEYPWPGNVRELENVIARAVLITPQAEIDSEVLFSEPANLAELPISLRQEMHQVRDTRERQLIAEALQKTNGNRSHAAKLLGISRSALYIKLKLHELTS